MFRCFTSYYKLKKRFIESLKIFSDLLANSFKQTEMTTRIFWKLIGNKQWGSLSVYLSYHPSVYQNNGVSSGGQSAAGEDRLQEEPEAPVGREIRGTVVIFSYSQTFFFLWVEVRATADLRCRWTWAAAPPSRPGPYRGSPLGSPGGSQPAGCRCLTRSRAATCPRHLSWRESPLAEGGQKEDKKRL